MTKPIDITHIIEYQRRKLHRAKKELNIKQMYAESFIYDVLVEHEKMVANKDGNIIVTMSPERYDLIKNIRPKKV